MILHYSIYTSCESNPFHTVAHHCVGISLPLNHLSSESKQMVKDPQSSFLIRLRVEFWNFEIIVH